ncbi:MULTISPECIES: isochorismatase family protein [Serratia]|jgi:Amidases related to nicotinamidase|uniref:isochorismatase family protein n=1 Tax=Serratia TaxID=613 RepID=UPI000B41AD3B|nr:MULTISPECIES: isochorismatase family protein [Serratia]RNW11459.1 isochorismatase family protein [Serratia nematodiphila]MBH1891371.1 isochorismatase family protein [Serratia marcescens]MBM0401432.1 isochorismatase family protein [Serratia sp. 4542]PJI68860.1 isochorismatase [Serratia sp. TKO39]QHC43673.1 isochorismatase family protein [Serratia marcescens]
MKTLYRTLALAIAMAGAAQPAFAAPAAPQPHTQTQQASGPLQLLDRNNSVLLLVDHQIGLITGVRDMDSATLKHNVVALAKAAQVMGIPVVVTSTGANGPFGPIIPELKAALPGVKIIDRHSVNAWDDANVRKAVEATGRKKIVIAGVSLEVCAGFPAITAKAAGYDTYVVIDASGTFNQSKHEAGMARLIQAGVIPTDYGTVGVEWLGDNGDAKAGELYGALDMPATTLVNQLFQAKGK